MNIESPVFVSCLKEVTPNMLKTVYSEVNESFIDYFGMRVETPFIRQVILSDQVSKNIAGTYETVHAHITLYPHQHQESGDISYMRTVFAHEMGHALYRQLLHKLFPYLPCSMLLRRGFAIAAEEAFANLASTVDQGEGNPKEVTKLLRPHITKGSLLFSPDRITRYPKEADCFKDPALLNFILQEYGLDTFMSYLLLVPSVDTSNNLSRLERIIGGSRCQSCFYHYDSSLNNVFGNNSDSLSKSANSWYSYVN